VSPDSERVPLASSSERHSRNNINLFLEKGIETLLEADFSSKSVFQSIREKIERL
jgi:hypothetical protein